MLLDELMLVGSCSFNVYVFVHANCLACPYDGYRLVETNYLGGYLRK